MEAPLSSVKLGPRMPQKLQVDPFSLYDYEGDGTALVDNDQQIEFDNSNSRYTVLLGYKTSRQ